MKVYIEDNIEYEENYSILDDMTDEELDEYQDELLKEFLYLQNFL